MWFMLGVQFFLILMFIGFGYAILKKKAYWLISNFNGRNAEEQEELVRNRYPQRVGKLMVATAAGMAILLPLTFTSFRFSMELQFGFMLFFLLGGVIYLSKYEVKKKRKRSYIISSLMAAVTIGGLAVLSYLGYQDFELKTGPASFEITGIYGDEWNYSEIRRVELFDDMPEATWKQNGFGLSTMAKGHFKVKEYGSSLLFIHKGSAPYMYIETDSNKIFINSKNPEQTREWFLLLAEKAE